MTLTSQGMPLPPRARGERPVLSPTVVPGRPLLGNVLELWRDPLGVLVRGTRDHGPFAEFRFGPYRYLVIDDVDAIKHVLVDQAKNYPKSRSYDALRLVLGNGLVTSEGDFWRRQRKLAQPGFHKQRLAGFAKTMSDATTDLVSAWAAQPNGKIDVHAEMMALTLRIVGRTLFGIDLSGDAAAVGDAMSVGIEHANDYAESLVKVPPWIPTPNNLRFGRAVKVLDEMVFKIIEERRRASERGDYGDDLLGMLMEARDDDDRGMTDRQLRDEVMTLVLAGHETTASNLAWTFHLLSLHPDVERRLHAELRTVLGDRAPTFEDLPKLRYTSMVISESLRLYPPAWVFERVAREDDLVPAGASDYRVAKGTVVAVCPYTLHRSPRYWENPEGFDPERFTPEQIERRPKNAFLPFATGPRQCIGNAFALMEAQIVLATIVQRFRLSLVPGSTPEPDAKVTLRPKGGLPMMRTAR